ncbi:DUF2817 domain-containing protein [Coraliomargarita sp. W4R53]
MQNHITGDVQSIPVEALVSRLLTAEKSCGFTPIRYGTQKNFELCCATRVNSAALKTVYISSGMHGDEPAGPLALLKLLEEQLLPLEEFNWAVCPLLNPVGLSLHQRENEQGIDLNRDYYKRTSDEVRSHTKWVDAQAHFDLALFLHEDSDPQGFYMHECQICKDRSQVHAILHEVSKLCPIEMEKTIDGMQASEGIVHPWIESKFKNRWMESFYLRAHSADLGFIFETPSSIDLTTRVNAHATAVMAALTMLRD